jgi:hypothetical protein
MRRLWANMESPGETPYEEHSMATSYESDGHEYERPAQVVDSDLPTEKKIALLEDWRLDLIERQRATEENMPGSATASGEIGDALQQVNEALTKLRAAAG